MNDIGNDTSLIPYRVRVNDQPATVLFDTGASMSDISTRFFDSLKHKPKIIKCSRALRGAGGGALIPKGECFLQIKIGKQTFRYRVVIVHNLNCDYVIDRALQRLYHVATVFSVTGRHFLSVNGQMVVQSIPTPTIEPIIKNKGKIKLHPHFITVVSIKTSPNINEINHKFPLPNSMIPINVVYKFDNKVPHKLKIPILNTNNNVANIIKNMALVSQTSRKSRQHFQFGMGHITSNQTVGSGGSSGSTTVP